MKIVYTINFIVLLILLLVGIYLNNRENKIKSLSTRLIEGKVVKYAARDTAAPVVEYNVDGKNYRKTLNYTYVFHTKSPHSKIKVELKDDILDTKLRLKSNSMVSINTVMRDTFPIGSSMNVYYNPNNPKIAFVERFAPMHLGKIFICSSLIFMTILIVIICFSI